MERLNQSFHRVTLNDLPRNIYLRQSLRAFVSKVDGTGYWYFVTLKSNGKYSHKRNLTGIVWYIDYLKTWMTGMLSGSEMYFVYEMDTQDQLHVHGVMFSPNRLAYANIPRVKGLRIDAQLIKDFNLCLVRCVNCGYVDGIKVIECFNCTKVRESKEKIIEYMLKDNLPVLVRIISPGIFGQTPTNPVSCTAYWDAP